MEGQPYRYRASTWWLVTPAGFGLLVAFAVADVARGNEWAVPWAVAAVLWCSMTLRHAFAVTVDAAAGMLELRMIFGRRRRALADLRRVELGGGRVLLTFERGTALVFSGPGVDELVDHLHRVQPALRDPAVRAFNIVLRGYDRVEVDDHRQRLRDLRGSAGLPADIAPPDFSIVVRGYDRAEVDAAIAELTAAASSSI
jgi:hypothetical protein